MHAEAADLGPTDETLLARAGQGDRHALSALLYRHYEPLASYIGARLAADGCAAVDADDVLQQTLVTAFRGFATFHPRGPDSFGRWLRAIADHARVDELRKQRRSRDRAGQDGARPADRLLELLGVDSETPSRAAARREAGRALRTALAALQPRQREAVALVYLEELSLGEAAAHMGTTKPAVHSLVYRGLQKLREVLGSLSKYLSRA